MLASVRLPLFSVTAALCVLPFTDSVLLVTVPPLPLTTPVMRSSTVPAVVTAKPTPVFIEVTVVLVAPEVRLLGRFACTLARAMLCGVSIPPCCTVKPLAVP